MLLRTSVVLASVLAYSALVACDRSAKVDAEPKGAKSVESATAKDAVPPASASGSASAGPAPMPPASEVAAVATGSNAFGFALWPKVGKPGANMAFSPASLSMAFAMVYPGAKGETAAEIKRALRFPEGAAATASSWGKLQRGLEAPGRPLQLRIANRLFGEKTYAFEPGYLDLTKTVFEAPLEPVDFKTAADPARVRINGWVEEKTEKRIKDLLPPRSLDELTRLVLVNAVYFLADWAHPFEKESTRDAPFEVSPSVKKTLPTMHGKVWAPLAKADGVKLLELPYKGDSMAMVFVLPDKKDGLPAVEKMLSAEKLAAWRKASTSGSVEVALPRFEITSDAGPLREALASLGMSVAFDKDKADFTGIGNPATKDERLHVSNVFHKAFVKVDEKGTEAAAATAMVMAAGGGAPVKGEEFVADHPFAFFIVDKSTQLVLFAGRVVDPEARHTVQAVP